MDDDGAQVHAYQQAVPWHAWNDEPVRAAIGAIVLHGLREHVGGLDVDVDWPTLDGPREAGRTWLVDTGEADPDVPGETLWAFLPAPPEEDPDAPPTLVLLRAEVTSRPRPKGDADGTLSA